MTDTEIVLNLLPLELGENGRYRLNITRFSDLETKTKLWEVAYTDENGNCICDTTGRRLSVAAAKMRNLLTDKALTLL